MEGIRRDPVIINKIAPNTVTALLPYKILSCALRSGGAGKTIGVLALFREDIGHPFTDRDARLAEALARKCVGVIDINYDSLSGLYTRPAFESRVRSAVTNAMARPWTALYIDADQLHVINDGFGMHVGDSVLGKLGELIRHRLPPGAFASRISGDRFAVLLPTQLEDAERFAESLREGRMPPLPPWRVPKDSFAACANWGAQWPWMISEQGSPRWPTCASFRCRC